MRLSINQCANHSTNLQQTTPTGVRIYRYSKSTSLAPLTRLGLANALASAVTLLCQLLENASAARVVPQAFRDAFACQLYMLYSFMFFLEADAKGTSATASSNTTTKQAATEDNAHVAKLRRVCATAMLQASQTAATRRSILWPRGVPDEAVLVLPCRIAYPMLEVACTGVLARRAACGDEALRMIAVTAQATESLLSTVTAALMDLMHSFENMAPLVAELCCCLLPSSSSVEDAHNKHHQSSRNEDSSGSSSSSSTSTRLAVELIREVGRLNLSQDSKSLLGIKNVAPFVSELASLRPRLVLQHLSHLLPHLQAEPYSIRSSIVTAVSHVLQYIATAEQQAEQQQSLENAEGALLAVAGGDDGSIVDHHLGKTRSSLLDVLAERVYDISSFTRSAALKAWIRLCHSQSIPKQRFLSVTQLAMDRLQDKAVMVRKQSMQLLTLLLQSNPYQGSLDPEPYRLKLAELYEYIKANLPVDLAEAQQNADQDDDTDELERATLAAAIAEADVLLASTENLSDKDKEYCDKVQALKFTEAVLEFINLFEGATVALKGMLLSANTSDVTEALRFFVQARHFQLPCAVSGMKSALALMWSTETSIREEVLRAFMDVFIAVSKTEGSELLPLEEIAKNLLLLVDQASESELASIEEAIIRLVTDQRLPDDLFLMLWSIASKGNAGTRASAFQLIAMGAGADRSIIDSKSRLKLLLDAGLGDTMKEFHSWKLAGAASICLQRIARAQVDASDAKYLILERILEELCSICRGDLCQDDDAKDTLQWFSAAEHAITAIFVISNEPEVACKNVLVGMYEATMGGGVSTVHSLRLARFFHVLGHTALNLLVYTEALSASVRRGNAKRSVKKQEAADTANRSKRRNGENNDDDNAIEAELGVAAEAEAENERRLTDIAEKEIVGRNLISMFSPLLIRAVGNEGGKFNSEILMQASTLALCKFMCVSGSFCEKHLPLLFGALANAPSEDTTMRANTVIALGDLAFRFPNEVEPYTPRMYACLRDTSTKVRRHTLMVLTHLILNDMIKVKGQVCEIVMCLRDQDSRIRDMSRLLFHELSKRSNNPIYNLLPEIISQLSLKSIPTDDFRHMMSFLLAFITKERQSDMLTEKLCQRFPKCTTIGQSADLAYCISLLKLTEKSIKALSDNFVLYKNFLFDEQVNKWFLSIISKAKKFIKPERKQLLEEWETKLNEFVLTGSENQKADEKASKAKARAKKQRSRKQPVAESENLSFEESDEEALLETGKENENVDTGNPAPSTKKKPPRRVARNLPRNNSVTASSKKGSTGRGARRGVATSPMMG